MVFVVDILPQLTMKGSIQLSGTSVSDYRKLNYKVVTDTAELMTGLSKMEKSYKFVTIME